MKVLLNSSIKSISGKSGGMMFRTFKKRDGSTETRMYLLPRKRNGKYGYTRKSKASEKEQAARSLFMRRQTRVRELMKAHKFRTLKEAWDFVRQEITK